MRACAPTDLGGSLGGTMPLDHLWATWRSAYVSKLADSRLLPSEGEAAGRSLFERILAGADEEGDEAAGIVQRSEEHTSELQSLMRISYSVFCLKQKNKLTKTYNISQLHMT